MASWSHSKLAAFEQCPLKFKFAYIDRLERREVSVERFLGSCVHKTLERLFTDVLMAKAPSLEELLDHFREGWEEGWHDVIRIRRKGYDRAHYRALGERCVLNFYRRHHPFDDATTLCTEERLTFALDDEEHYRFQGYADRIARRPDGNYEIHDYKTSLRLPSQESIDKDRQLALYEIGLRRRWPDVGEVHLIWHYVALDRMMISHRTPEELEGVRELTIALIDRIEDADDYPPDEGPLCPWCEYDDVCPCRQHLVETKQLPSEERTLEEGVRLVDAWVDLTAMKRESVERLEALQEEIISYAERKGIDSLFGSTHRIRLRRRQGVGLPAQGQAERETLEQCLREAEKWDEVTQLSGPRLRRALEQGEWDEELRQRILEYATLKENVSLSLSRLDEREE